MFLLTETILYSIVSIYKNIGEKMSEINEISEILSKIKNKEDIVLFLNELFTGSELEDLSKRWRILKMLNAGETQRDIAKELGVGLCKVTRGAKVLKDNNAITRKYLRRK